MPLLDKDRLFPKTEVTLRLARELYQNIAKLPIISPHGHCDPSWFSENKRFPNPAQLFVTPDHYIFRMLVSQGLTLNELGIKTLDDSVFENDPQKIWKKFSENYYLFRGTPTAMWLDYSFEKVFGITELLTPATSDFYYKHIEEKLCAIMCHKSQNPEKFVNATKLLNKFRAGQCNGELNGYAEAYSFDSVFPFSDIRSLLPPAPKSNKYYSNVSNSFL